MYLKHGGVGCFMDLWGCSVNVSMFDPSVIDIHCNRGRIDWKQYHKAILVFHPHCCWIGKFCSFCEVIL